MHGLHFSVIHWSQPMSDVNPWMISFFAWWLHAVACHKIYNLSLVLCNLWVHSIVPLLLSFFFFTCKTLLLWPLSWLLGLFLGFLGNHYTTVCGAFSHTWPEYRKVSPVSTDPVHLVSQCSTNARLYFHISLVITCLLDVRRWTGCATSMWLSFCYIKLVK